MKNLLQEIPAEHRDLQSRAAKVWRDKIVPSGGLALVGGVTALIFELSPPETSDYKAIMIGFGAVCLAGVGMTGHGFGQLSMMSQELASRLEADLELIHIEEQ